MISHISELCVQGETANRTNRIAVMTRMLSRICFCFSKVKVPKVGELQKYWDNLSEKYQSFDWTPQTFFYSFLNLTSIWEAQNILEVACGTGKLLPLAMQLKQQSAHYTATDLSPNMINLAKKTLRTNYEQYQSKLSFEEWLNSHNFHLKPANAEEPIISLTDKKFDRIYCNMVLMLTQNAEKMLSSLGESAVKGCLMGVSVLGDKEKNPFVSAIQDSFAESGFNFPPERSNFHLHGKVGNLAKKYGWEVVMEWEQSALFPVVGEKIDQKKHSELLFNLQQLPPQPRGIIKKILLKKLNQLLSEKKGLKLTSDLLVLRKN